MSKQNIKSELADYLNASTATDSGEWSLDAMAEELYNMGYNSIDDMDEHEFTCFLMDWDGMVVNDYGRMVNFEQAMNVADRDVCEALIDEGAESNQDFFDRYVVEHEKKYGAKFAPASLEA